MDTVKAAYPEVIDGVRQLVIDTAIQALIEHAEIVAPGTRDRILKAVLDYTAGLDITSSLEQAFVEGAKAYAEALVRPLSSRQTPVSRPQVMPS